MVSELFDASVWQPVAGFESLTDVTYHHDLDGRIARVAFNRPEVRNAFRRTPSTSSIAPSTTPARTRASASCCSPATARARRTAAGRSARAATSASAAGTGTSTRTPRRRPAIDPHATTGRLHILEVQRLIRFMPKVVIAVVPGWAAGGGHSLHVVCDLTIASGEHGRFKQTDADVGSFDAGYGSAYFARQIGQKFAREVFFLAQEYAAQRAYEMGAVNAVVPHAELEPTALAWAETILTKSPDRDPHAQVRLQRRRRRHGRPAGVRRRGDAARLRHRRGGRGSRRVPREARPRLVAVPLAVLSALRDRCAAA